MAVNDVRAFRALGVLLLLLSCALFPGKALAHKVMVFGWVEDGTVKTISKFNGGKRVAGGTIRVFDDAGNFILEGVTDENGEFEFPVPGKTGLKLELEATMGHKNIGLIPADQFADAGFVSEPAPVETPPAAAGEAPRAEENAAFDGVGQKALERSVETVLDRKVMPLLHSLVEKEDKPGVSDILGGIGYIVGLMGLALYMKGRRKN